ncbi:hypothetical protein [Lactococcus garvieae]|uniref:hypothetical protein n=1 Tax=Lactococcus garvieae TaxID=1363 RepID=UPI00214B213E|nr:hypothetical protein [Lactococcus garvieae]
MSIITTRLLDSVLGVLDTSFPDNVLLTDTVRSFKSISDQFKASASPTRSPEATRRRHKAFISSLV